MKKIVGQIKLISPLYVPALGGDSKSVYQTKVNTVSGIESFPFFPGNDFRGRLRRDGMDVILGRLNGKRVSMELVHTMSCGSETGSPSKNKKNEKVVSDYTVAEYAGYKSNAFAGLFGGGFHMITSSYRVGDMMPATVLLNESGVLPVGYEGGLMSCKSFELLQEYFFNRWDDAQRTPEKVFALCEADEVARWSEMILKDESLIAEKNAELAEKKKTENASKDKKEKEPDASKVRSALKLTNLQTFSAIIPGTLFAFNMDLVDNLTDAQIGLMLLSMERMVNKQDLGAAVRKGFGRYNAWGLDFIETDGTSTPLFEATGISTNPYKINRDLHSYIDAFEEEAADIESFISEISESMTTEKAKLVIEKAKLVKE